MEIKEIVSYNLLPSANILEVSFRTIEDSEEQIRNIQIDYNEVENYGFQLETESIDIFFDEYEDDLEDETFEDEIELDEYELVNFLNEYFLINPDRLPESIVF